MAGMYETALPMKVAELGDSIFIAESTKTPFSRLLKRGAKPVQGLCEWPAQKYPDRAFAGTLDGTDITTFESTTREKISAYWMWLMTKGWMVSKLANLTRTAGVPGKEEAKQAADDALILAQMVEKQLLSDVDTRAESGPASYRSRGVFSWLSATAQGVLPVPANFRPASASHYTGALADFKPASMETMLEAAATAKKAAVDLVGYVGLKLKAQMSSWAQRDPDAEADEAASTQTWNLDASEKKLIHVVNFFEFDAGSVKTIPSWYLLSTEATGAVSDYTPRSGAFLDMSMWELAFYQPPASWIEPPKSGGPRGYHDVVYILKCLNPLGQCMVKTNT